MKTKHLTQNQRDVLIAHFESYLSGEPIQAGKYPIYDLLDQKGFINLKIEEVHQLYNTAQKELIAMPSNQHNKNFYSGNRSLSVIFRAKTTALKNYFDELIKKDIHIKTLTDERPYQVQN